MARYVRPQRVQGVVTAHNMERGLYRVDTERPEGHLRALWLSPGDFSGVQPAINLAVELRPHPRGGSLWMAHRRRAR